MTRLLSTTLQRIFLQAIPTMAGITVISFLLLKLMPGDAVDAILGMSGTGSKETAEALRKTFGLDASIPVQLLHYLAGVVTLNFGMSSSFGAPAFDVIMARLPDTVLLMVAAFALALVLGIIMGWIMAVFANRLPDRLLTSISLFLYSAPNFWIGLMAIVVFSVWLGWLPSDGAETVGASLTGWDFVSDRLAHLVLPATVLSFFYATIYARLTRAAMIEVLQQDYIRTAIAKGLHPLVLQLRHGLRNALIPVTTVAGLNFGNLIGATMVVETVFNWPGIGSLTMGSLAARDINVLLGILLLSSAVVIVSNLAVDWIAVWLDPRIER